MSKFLGEHADIKGAIVMAGGSSANSQPFALRDVSRISVLCQMQNAYSCALTTAIAPATVSVVCGTFSDPASMAVLTGGTIVMGMSTAAQLTNWETIAVAALGTLGTGRMLVIDGTTFTIHANASATDKQLSASAASIFTDALACAIATFCTHLETYGQVTNGNATATSILYIRRKEFGPGMAAGITAYTSAQATSVDQVHIQGIKQNAIIEFRPADVLATNSSYTHFGVRFNCAVTTQNFAAQVIRVTGYQSTNVNRIEI